MRAGVNIGASERLELKHAILVYRSLFSGGSAYLAVCDVVPQESGQPRLGAARPADLSFLRALAESVQAALPPEVLPEYVLCRTPDRVVWWSEACGRPMYFSGSTPLGKVSGRLFPHPALVWKVEGRRLYLRALRESVRPTADTELYIAPYWNTDLDGAVCLGSMKRPSKVSVDTLREWEAGYFGSLFTGQNGKGNRVKGKGGLVSLWKSVAGKAVFPASKLVSAGQTMADFIGGGRARA